MGLLFAQGHVDATWHSGQRGSAKRAHVAPTWCGCDVHIYIYHKYKGYSTYKHSVLEFKLTHIIAPHYKPDTFLWFFPCGTKFHTVFSVQDTWQTARRWIKQSTDYHAWITWTRGPSDPSNARDINRGVIKAVISYRGEHPDRQIVIQRRRSNAFYNASQRASSEGFITDRTAATFLKWLRWTVPS